MPAVEVLIFGRGTGDRGGPLESLLEEARTRLATAHGDLFLRAGAARVSFVAGHTSGASFGEALAGRIGDARTDGVVVLGAGSVARLREEDARLLLDAAASRSRVALTNNRYSSDVCAISAARTLRDIPALPTDNALPRWLAEAAGYEVRELRGRDRLALDLDTPLDLALLAKTSGVPRPVRLLAREAGISVPRRGELLDVLNDARRELLLFGRSGARTLHWLERNAACRVRFLAEERGLRASSPLAFGPGAPVPAGERGSRHDERRPPRATLGRLIALRGADSFAHIIGELADGAIVDTRVLLADRLGVDESRWPTAEDRYASDLLRARSIIDDWLRALTESAAGSDLPILLGGHSLVGPGLPLVFAGRRSGRRRPLR